MTRSISVAYSGGGGGGGDYTESNRGEKTRPVPKANPSTATVYIDGDQGYEEMLNDAQIEGDVTHSFRAEGYVT